MEQGVAVADFLIFDPIFPRSVRYCLRRCQAAVHAISRRPLSQPDNEVERGLLSLIGWLQLVNIDDLVRAGLHESLTSVIDRIHEIGSRHPPDVFRFPDRHARQGTALPVAIGPSHFQGKKCQRL